MKKATSFFVAAIVAAIATSQLGLATTLDFDLRPATPGGTQQIYHLENGNYLGLWGISGGATDQVGLPFTSAELTEDFGINSDRIVGYYYNTPAGGAWAGNPSDFTPFGATVTIDAVSSSSGTGKLFDSFWVEWTGGNLFNLAQNSNMPASATLSPPPAVPEPSSILMVVGGLAALGIIRCRATR